MDISKDNPRVLRRVSDGAETRVVDAVEYYNLTSARGYRDVTDENGGQVRNAVQADGGPAEPVEQRAQPAQRTAPQPTQPQPAAPQPQGKQPTP